MKIASVREKKSILFAILLLFFAPMLAFRKAGFFGKVARSHQQLHHRYSRLFSTSKNLPSSPDDANSPEHNAEVQKFQRLVFNDLRNWRREVAQEGDKPLYMIMKNSVLESIVSVLPSDLQGLKSIKGFGAKSEVFAPKIIEIVNRRIPDGIDRSALPEFVDPNAKAKKVKATNTEATDSSSQVDGKKTRKKRTKNDVVEEIYPTVEEVPFENLNEEQQLAARHILDTKGRNAFISGSAGTGKSYLLKHLIEQFRMRHGTAAVAVTAPTGIAAINVDGVTIHSFAGIGLGKGDRETLVKKVMDDKKAVKRWKRCKVLIIDEVSMLDVQLFELLDVLAQRVRGIECPFGGLQLIIVGDFLQLPPVSASTSNGFENVRFCFQSSVWEAAGLNTEGGMVDLNTVVRQNEDDNFVDMLNSLRRGITTPALLQELEKCVVGRKPLPNDGIVPTKLYCTNKDVDRENQQRLADLKEDDIKIEAVNVENFKNMTQRAQKSLRELADKRVPPTITLKRGAQVMLLRNKMDFNWKSRSEKWASIDQMGSKGEKGLVNGSRGVVVGFTGSKQDGGLIPLVRFDCGKVIAVGRTEYEIFDPEGGGCIVRSQIPLKLAWAVTVHKSQGSTLSRAELMITNAFDYGQAYVALSRVVDLDGLWLTRPLAARSVKAHPAVLAFYGFTKQMNARSPQFKVISRSPIYGQKLRYETTAQPASPPMQYGQQGNKLQESAGATRVPGRPIEHMRASASQKTREGGPKGNTIWRGGDISQVYAHTKFANSGNFSGGHHSQQQSRGVRTVVPPAQRRHGLYNPGDDEYEYGTDDLLSEDSAVNSVQTMNSTRDTIYGNLRPRERARRTQELTWAGGASAWNKMYGNQTRSTSNMLSDGPYLSGDRASHRNASMDKSRHREFDDGRWADNADDPL